MTRKTGDDPEDLLEFAESDAPAPSRASVRTTTLDAQVGVARQLASMKLPPEERED